MKMLIFLSYVTKVDTCVLVWSTQHYTPDIEASNKYKPTATFDQGCSPVAHLASFGSQQHHLHNIF